MIDRRSMSLPVVIRWLDTVRQLGSHLPTVVRSVIFTQYSGLIHRSP